MTTKAHTPTHLVVHEMVANPRRWGIHVDKWNGKLVGTANTEELANRIVRCVNSHDDLVAGIEQALGCLEDPTGGTHVADMRLAATYLRAALAKAQP